MEAGCIPSFDLEAECWNVTLQGPLNLIPEEADPLHYRDLTDRLSLSEIKGCLVTVHCNDQISTTNLWFLTDFENYVWSKKIIIQNEVVANNLIERVQVLWVLDEGKMILLVQTLSGAILQIYDPTNTAINVLNFDRNSLCSAGVGIYTKSLLLKC
ncbi:hypothetical protein PR202_ga28001 [Eleusine coracana subsp. coracana]|uniref:F-box associated beta-propeller type 3 domain-containing protein n=1 Tax=Eleusine coracana subsp. coracana TaxID=191504 RepID=A0AAV5DID0_ELECO|nr:hypothetical protein PR202_ga28001 [Eleusine coracana subsp. coracana]